jgi:hypothetical protein
MDIHKNVSYGDAVFYNVAYDKELIPAIDQEYNDTLGVSVITDRKKLFQFLRVLEKTDSYKYVIIDLTFDKKDVSIYDDSLFNQIQRMRDIVVADHPKIKFARPELATMGKTGLVSYYTTSLSTNFARYEYTNNDKRSIPMLVYEKLNNKELKRYGLGRLSIYTLGGKLCQNSNFLTFDDFFNITLSDTLNNKYSLTANEYINLGKFLNNPITDNEELCEDVGNYTKSKYVVIGDFLNDIHDTYIGEKPGSLIIMRALHTLEEGKIFVSLSHTLLWGVVFLLISLSIINNKPISKNLPLVKKIPYKWFHFILSLITFGVVLLMCSTIEYAYYDQVYSLVVPVLYFSALKLIIQYKKYK